MNAIASPAILSAKSTSNIPDRGRCPTEVAASSQFVARYEPDNAVLWSTWMPSGIPCFNLELLRELKRGSTEIENYFSGNSPERPLHYVVLSSAIVNVFNTGGDLEYFQNLIAAQDRRGLTEYAQVAVEVVYRNYTSHNLKDVTTIALLEGDALGGGFESALSCDIVIAEKHVKAGFPEVLFNMFPGMGGLSFLSRRTGRQTVNELTRTGRQYSAQELFDLGVIDLVVDTGEGPEAVRRVIRQRDRQFEAHSAMNKIDRMLRPVTHEELCDVVQLWVDCALQMSPRSLEWMRRLHQQQRAAFGRTGRMTLVPTHAPALAA